MNTKISKQEVEEIEKESRKKVASLGGTAWWTNLSKEQQEERIAKIQVARKKKRDERKETPDSSN